MSWRRGCRMGAERWSWWGTGGRKWAALTWTTCWKSKYIKDVHLIWPDDILLHDALNLIGLGLLSCSMYDNAQTWRHTTLSHFAQLCLTYSPTSYWSMILLHPQSPVPSSQFIYILHSPHSPYLSHPFNTLPVIQIQLYSSINFLPAFLHFFCHPLSQSYALILASYCIIFPFPPLMLSSG